MCLGNAVGVCAWYKRMKDRETENEIEREQKSVMKERWDHCRNRNGEEPYFSTSLIFPPSNHLHFYVSYLMVDNPFFWQLYYIAWVHHFASESIHSWVLHLTNLSFIYSKLHNSKHMDQQYGGNYSNGLWYNNGCIVLCFNWICYNIIGSSIWLTKTL